MMFIALYFTNLRKSRRTKAGRRKAIANAIMTVKAIDIPN